MAAEVLAAGPAHTTGERRRAIFKGVWGGRLAQGFSLAACAGGVGSKHVFSCRTLLLIGELEAWQGELTVSSAGNDAGAQA